MQAGTSRQIRTLCLYPPFLRARAKAPKGVWGPAQGAAISLPELCVCVRVLQLVQSDISRVHAHTWLQILLMAFLMFYPMQIYQVRLHAAHAVSPAQLRGHAATKHNARLTAHTCGAV